MADRSYQEKLSRILEWSLEYYYNYVNEGKLYTKSSDQVISSLKFPDRIETWLIGNGDFENRSHGTDSGYLRILFTIGLIGAWINYYLFIKLMKKSVFYTKDIAYKYWIYSLYIVLFIVEIKEPFLIKPLISKAFFLFFTSCLIWVNSRRNYITFNNLLINT